MYKTTLSKLFGFTIKTLYNWKEEDINKGNRPVVELIEKYFTEEDVLDFIKTRNIERFNYIDKQERIINRIVKKETSGLDKYGTKINLLTMKLILELKQRYEILFPIAKAVDAINTGSGNTDTYFDNNHFHELYTYEDSIGMNGLSIMELDNYIKSSIFELSLIEKLHSLQLTAEEVYNIQEIISTLYDNSTLELMSYNSGKLINMFEIKIKSIQKKISTEYDEEHGYDRETMVILERLKALLDTEDILDTQKLLGYEQYLSSVLHGADEEFDSSDIVSLRVLGNTE